MTDILIKLDTYEAICDYAREHSERLDDERWQLGDCANVVMQKWSEKTVEDFARDIGQHKSTVYQYAKVAAFYEPSLRRRLRDDLPNINYSHMRDALRLKDVEAALEWLTFASVQGYSADEASHHLTERLGRAAQDSIEGVVTRIYHQDNGYYAVVKMDTDGLHSGQVVTVKIKR